MRGSSQAPVGWRSQDGETSYAIERLQFERWRSMSGVEKLALAQRLARDLIELSLLGLADRHPRLDRAELELRAARLRYGDELVDRALAAAGRDRR